MAPISSKVVVLVWLAQLALVRLFFFCQLVVVGGDSAFFLSWHSRVEPTGYRGDVHGKVGDYEEEKKQQ